MLGWPGELPAGLLSPAAQAHVRADQEATNLLGRPGGPISYDSHRMPRVAEQFPNGTRLQVNALCLDQLGLGWIEPFAMSETVRDRIHGNYPIACRILDLERSEGTRQRAPIARRSPVGRSALLREEEFESITSRPKKLLRDGSGDHLPSLANRHGGHSVSVQQDLYLLGVVGAIRANAQTERVRRSTVDLWKDNLGARRPMLVAYPGESGTRHGKEKV